MNKLMTNERKMSYNSAPCRGEKIYIYACSAKRQQQSTSIRRLLTFCDRRVRDVSSIDPGQTPR